MITASKENLYQSQKAITYRFYLEHLQEQRNDTAKTGKKGIQIVADTPVDMMGVEEL